MSNWLAIVPDCYSGGHRRAGLPRPGQQLAPHRHDISACVCCDRNEEGGTERRQPCSPSCLPRCCRLPSLPIPGDLARADPLPLLRFQDSPAGIPDASALGQGRVCPLQTPASATVPSRGFQKNSESDAFSWNSEGFLGSPHLASRSTRSLCDHGYNDALCPLYGCGREGLNLHRPLCSSQSQESIWVLHPSLSLRKHSPCLSPPPPDMNRDALPGHLHSLLPSQNGLVLGPTKQPARGRGHCITMAFHVSPFLETDFGGTLSDKVPLSR